MSDDHTFAVVYVRGPNWDEEKPFHAQADVYHHRDFLAAQHAGGKLVFGGPFLDDRGGLAVYTAPSKEELEKILATDQTIIQGLLRYEIHPYIVAFKRE